MKEEWQLQLDAAVDKYFAMSKLLQQDLEELLAHGEDTQSSRRNFIRAAASLVEGYTACFREMCQVGLKTGPGSLSRDEVAVLENERLYGSLERTKLTIRATFKMFQLPSVPDFGTKEWLLALQFLNKRDRLMHPKSVEDLDVPDSSWEDIYNGSVWLLQQLFGFMAQLARVHGI